jgi:hypothetical protein
MDTTQVLLPVSKKKILRSSKKSWRTYQSHRSSDFPQAFDTFSQLLYHLKTRNSNIVGRVLVYAQILHCLLLVSNEDSLESYVQKVTTWTEIKDHANEILTKFTNADRVREPRLAAERRAEAKEKANQKHKTTEAMSGGGFHDSSGRRHVNRRLVTY